MTIGFVICKCLTFTHIIMVLSLKLIIFPFQINPHYYNISIEGFHGETRDQRLTEFLQLNPGVPVVGLPEGSALRLMDEKLQFLAETSGVLFQKNHFDGNLTKREILADADLSFLLETD